MVGTKIEGDGYVITKTSESLIEAVLSGEIDLETAKSTIEHRMSLSEGKSMNVIIFISDIQRMKLEVLNHMSKHGSELIKASAFMVDNSLIANNLVNLFLGMQKGKAPIKIFKERKKAVDWFEEIS